MSDYLSQSCYPVCPINQLQHASCVEFRLPPDQKEAFLINWHGKFYAYLNSCPHTQVTLNWTPDQFLDFESKFIQCSLHGALFEPDSGFCIHGPCLGKSLTTLPVTERGGMLCIELDAVKTV
ncbi:MAG: Rieske 2Fe-2S domain-containing protein [Thioalkalispiraceae bacterium]